MVVFLSQLTREVGLPEASAPSCEQAVGAVGPVADAVHHTADMRGHVKPGGGEGLAGQRVARERDAAVIADGLARSRKVNQLHKIARRAMP